MSTTMKALYFKELGKCELREVPRPQILSSKDVIIKVTLTTICGSDVHLMHGGIPTTPGYILGHEYIGVIEEVGSGVTKFKKGDRVIGSPVPFCGECPNCLAGDVSHCFNAGIFGSGKEYGDLQGCHAEYLRIPHAEAHMVHIPDNLSDEDVIFVSDILSTGYTALLNGNMKKGDSIVIFGAGPVGLATVLAAKLFDPKKIILVGRKDEFRLNKGLELGATHIIKSSTTDPLKAIEEIAGPNGVDLAIDAAGAEESIQQAMLCAKLQGNVSLVGIAAGMVSFPFMPVFMKSLKITAGLADLGHIPELLDAVATGKIDTKPLITHRMSLSQAEEAMKLFESRTENVIKILLKP